MVCAELKEEFHLAIGGSLTHGRVAHTLSYAFVKGKWGGEGRSPVQYLRGGEMVMADLLFNIGGVCGRSPVQYWGCVWQISCSVLCARFASLGVRSLKNGKKLMLRTDQFAVVVNLESLGRVWGNSAVAHCMNNKGKEDCILHNRSSQRCRCTDLQRSPDSPSLEMMELGFT